MTDKKMLFSVRVREYYYVTVLLSTSSTTKNGNRSVIISDVSILSNEGSADGQPEPVAGEEKVCKMSYQTVKSKSRMFRRG